MSHAVRLGPKRYLAGIGEGFVGDGEQHLAVERDGELLALRTQSKPMPFLGRNLDVGCGKLLSPAFDHPVEADVVFERVGADDVIIVGRAQADYDAAGLVNGAGNRLEAKLDLQVLAGERLVDREPEPVIR